MKGYKNLTLDDAREVRRIYATKCPTCGRGPSLKDLAERFGISSPAIHKIVNGGSHREPAKPGGGQMTTDLHRELEAAQDRVAQLTQAIKQGTCAETGHDWIFTGGANIGCSERGCDCTVSVYVCSKCGDCDYGQNAERAQVIERCRRTGHGNR